MKRATALLLLVLTLLMFVGCSPSAGKESASDKDPFLEYAELPGLKGTHHPQLQSELARIRAERATPKLLDADAAGGDASARASGSDLVRVLTDAFTRQQLRFASQGAQRLFPRPLNTWTPITTAQAIQLRRKFDQPRLQIRQALLEPSAQLRPSYARGVGLDVTFVNAAEVYSRLEICRAVEHLTADEPEPAANSLYAVLRLVDLLARQKHVVSRLAAAGIRSEALAFAQVFLRQGDATAADVAELAKRIEWQLANWPPDANAWIGDRAMGMHIYEMIRGGQVLSVLTDRELDELQKADALMAFSEAASRSIDEDEWFYLDTMRSIIEACEQPFYRREQALMKLECKVKERRDSHDYPVVAGRLLLPGTHKAQRRQAADRALVEAWAIALAAARGKIPPSGENPLTGRPYAVEIGAEKITVSNIDPHRPELQVEVPRL